MYTLALVVLFAAIITLFSQEFIRMYKKIMSIKGAKTFLPLFLASCVVISYQDWILIGINDYRGVLNAIARGLVWIMPFGQYSTYVAYVLILTVLSIGPIFLLDWYWRRESHVAYPYSYLTSSLIWLISVFILIVV